MASILANIVERVLSQAKRVLVEKEDELKLILASMIVDGHVLLEGVPGVAKTLMAKVVAASFNLKFSRIQFTPDLLPSDITGIKIYNPKTKDFEIRLGPIFANIVLADEVNRASPRTQSALLEAMQEKQVTIEGESWRLPEPFTVIATQNPIELEGTFPLPEAQLDRFLTKIDSKPPSKEGLKELLKRIDEIEDYVSKLRPVATSEDILAARRETKKVHVDESIYDYITRIVSETHNHHAVRLGSSPRGAIALLKLSRAWALMDGRDYVIPDDVKNVAVPALSHRIILKPEYSLDHRASIRVIEEVLERVPVPKP
ncbi:MAG: MoxR family ATPase [Pyrodictiaceae archaeon]